MTCFVDAVTFSCCRDMSEANVAPGLDMHMHAGHSLEMRTTVEITDRQRAKLLQLAAERGVKGFSELVQDAIDAYLEANAARKELVKAAVDVLGSLSEAEARRLEARTTDVRKLWRTP